MSKLTLSVDDRVVSQAKKYAKRRGISISKLVESYLSAVAGRPPAADTLVLRLVRGALKENGTRAYGKHLAAAPQGQTDYLGDFEGFRHRGRGCRRGSSGTGAAVSRL